MTVMSNPQLEMSDKWRFLRSLLGAPVGAFSCFTLPALSSCETGRCAWLMSSSAGEASQSTARLSKSRSVMSSPARLAVRVIRIQGLAPHWRELAEEALPSSSIMSCGSRYTSQLVKQNCSTTLLTLEPSCSTGHHSTRHHITRHSLGSDVEPAW